MSYSRSGGQKCSDELSFSLSRVVVPAWICTHAPLFFFSNFTFQFVSVVVPLWFFHGLLQSVKSVEFWFVFWWLVSCLFWDSFITWVLFQALPQKPDKIAEWPWLLGLAGALPQLNPYIITGWNRNIVFRVMKKKLCGIWNSFIITCLVLEVYAACFSLHASSSVGQYDPGFSAGQVARLSQALPHVTGALGIF